MSEALCKVGIVGFGRIGAEHAAWIDAGARTRVAAVYDPTPARRAIAAARGLRVVGSLAALLDDSGTDAVLISTPTSMHLEPAVAALRAGKHVMVEKPMTLDAAGARELIDEAGRAGRVLSVFHCRRWDADFLALRRAITGGLFGRVFNVESRLGQWASCVGPAAKEYRPGWRNEAAFGGGGLYDWGSHFLDQLWRLLWPARPARVFAQLRGNVWTRDDRSGGSARGGGVAGGAGCDDLARVVIDFDDGCAALCEINTTTTRPLPRWHVDGERGSAQGPFSLAFDTGEWARLRFAPADGSPEVAVERAEPGLSETAIWQRFAAACAGEGEPAVTARSALQTMELLDAARASARDGRAVPIDTGAWAID